MTKSEYQSAREAASHLNLSDRDVTSGMNGYPEPYIGRFIDGFEKMKDAQDFVDNFGGEISIAHSRDGWNNCELKGGIGYYGEEFTPSSEDYGDDYNVVDSKEELENEAYWILNDRKKSDEEVAEMDAEEKEEYENEISALQKHGDDLMKKCENINWEKDSVVLCQGNFYDTVAKKSMGHSHDTHHYSIGVFILNDLEEVEYLNSDEAISETLKTNQYEFTKEGNIFS